jgi:hypothetical protein
MFFVMLKWQYNYGNIVGPTLSPPSPIVAISYSVPTFMLILIDLQPIRFCLKCQIYPRTFNSTNQQRCFMFIMHAEV